MQPPKMSDKQRSEMILHTYFPEWYPERNYAPFPENIHDLPKEIYDQWIENVKAFIQLS